jgi:hypothetical protein
MENLKTLSEPEWVFQYYLKTEHPLPVVMGTRGTWTGNGKPMIILVGFTIPDVLVLGDIYGVSHHPVREMKYKEITYYAINIIDKKHVNAIINDWKPTG